MTALNNVASAGVTEVVNVADHATKQAGVALGAVIDAAEATAQGVEGVAAVGVFSAVGAARGLLAEVETLREKYVAALRKATGAATDLVP